MFTFGNFSIAPNIFSWIFLGAFILSLAFAIWYSRGFHTYLRSSESSRVSWWLWNSLFGLMFFAIGLSFFTLLSEPVWKSSHEKVSVSGNSIVFALDLSKSMLAEDMKPSRIEVAKRLLSDFVSKGNISKLGLVIFAGEAFTAVPLTDDRDAFLDVLAKISPNTIRQELPGLSGTSIGNGLLLSKDLLERNPDGKPVIILLTDGEANTGIDPVPVVKSMSGGNIPVYSIGIGSEAGTDLYTTDRNGTKRYFLGEDGKPIRAILDEWLLRFVSSSTNGEYFRASDETGLSDIFKSLAKLSDGKKSTVVVESQKPLETSFIYAIFGCFLALLVLRRKIGEASFF